MLKTVVDTGGEDLFFLNQSDRQYINQLIDRERRRQEGGPPQTPTIIAEATYSPDVLLAKIPTGGIDARAGTLPGKADCEIFQIIPSDETDPYGSTPTITAILNPDATHYKLTVYNIYSVKWYVGSNPIYIQITRDKFGFWFGSKPSYVLKVVVGASDITAGSFGSVNIWANGVDTTETMNVSLNWMHGGQLISAGKEALVRYFEDENKWVFIASECEV